MQVKLIIKTAIKTNKIYFLTNLYMQNKINIITNLKKDFTIDTYKATIFT